MKTEEWHQKVLLVNYWNELALGSVQTYFMDGDSYVSLKRKTTHPERVVLLILAENINFLKYKNEGMGPKKFIV